MKTIALNEAQRTLVELIHRLVPGEVVTITENERPVARLVPITSLQVRPPRPRPPITGVPKAGALAGRLVVPDDFKAPLEEVREYGE